MVIAITSTVLFLSIGAFHAFKAYQQTLYVSRALTKSIAQARLQAVFRHQTVIIIPRANNWQKGWVLQLKDSQQILNTFPEMPLEIKANREKSPAIAISPEGWLEGNNRTFSYGNIYLIINRGGRTRIEKIKQLV